MFVYSSSALCMIAVMVLMPLFDGLTVNTYDFAFDKRDSSNSLCTCSTTVSQAH